MARHNTTKGGAAGRRAPIHRPHAPASIRHPESEPVWGHAFKFGDTELYIGPPKVAATVGDAIRRKTILGLRERTSDPFEVVGEFRSVTAAKEFVQAMIRGLEARGNAAGDSDIPAESILTEEAAS